MDDGRGPVDIRPADQRAETGEIPGALVIARNVLEWRLEPGGAHRYPEAPGPDAVVILACQHGCQSSLDGGIEAWSAAGLALRT